jgi:glycosyltransferase involved in cell wall biosynthesis
MKKRSKILVLSQFFQPEYVTSSVLVTQMAEDLAAAGLDVEVLCGMPKEYLDGQVEAPSKENYKGMLIRRAHYLQLSRKTKIGRLLNYFSLIVSMAWHWPLFFRYEYVIVYTLPPLLPLLPALMNVFFGKKFVFVCYDLYPDLAIQMQAIGRGSAIDKVMRFTNSRAYPRASAIVAIGEEMKQYMLSSGLAMDASRIKVIPNWYDGDPNAYREMDEAKKDCFTVAYSGNMGVCQDMDTILKCAEVLKGRQDIHFVFTGHGNKADSLKQEAERLGLANVEFHGYLMGQEYSNMLNNADCFIVSLEKGMEGLAVPSKTYSYLAAGRPVLAIIDKNTDISRLLKQNNCGFTVENGDGAGMARYILSMAEDHAALTQMGRNARKLYEEQFRREICTTKYVELMENLMNNQPL